MHKPTQSRQTVREIIVSLILSKQRFCQHGRHPKISITNIGGILHHSAHVRKQKTFKSYVLSYVLKIIQQIDTNLTQFLIHSPLGNLMSV